MGLDIGSESTKMICDELDSCKTVVWNGPMGVFEFEAFAKGTFAVAKKLAELTEKGAITIIGGGDSVAAVEQVRRNFFFCFVKSKAWELRRRGCHYFLSCLLQRT